MMSSVNASNHVQVWGIDLNGLVFVLGTITIDRTDVTVAYTAGTGPEQCRFPSEAAAAEWLAKRSPTFASAVFIGRWMVIPYHEWSTNQPPEHDRLRLHAL